MHHSSNSDDLYSSALALWEQRRLSEADSALRQLIGQSDENDVRLPEYFGALAGLLVSSGRNNDAEDAYEIALSTALRIHGNNSSVAVIVARYFLAHHLVSTQQANRAIEVTEPSVAVAGVLVGNLHFIRAIAFAAMGQQALSHEEVRSALSATSSPEQRARMEEQLKHALGPSNSA